MTVGLGAGKVGAAVRADRRFTMGIVSVNYYRAIDKLFKSFKYLKRSPSGTWHRYSCKMGRMTIMKFRELELKFRSRPSSPIAIHQQ